MCFLQSVVPENLMCSLRAVMVRSPLVLRPSIRAARAASCPVPVDAFRGGKPIPSLPIPGYECAGEKNATTTRLQEASRSPSLQGRQPPAASLRAVIIPGRCASSWLGAPQKDDPALPDVTYVGNFAALQHIERLPRLE